MKTLQFFSKEYLDRCAGMTPDQILEFIENYRELMAHKPEKCQLISLKIEPSLLQAFKDKAKLSGVRYQSQIKELMRNWLSPIDKPF